MLKSEHRKSGLFSSLKSRRSLKDLSARVQKTSLLISVPFTHPTHDTNSMYSLQSTISSMTDPLAPLMLLDLNVPGRRQSKISADIPEHVLKRNSTVWKNRSSSPSSEVTLATISATPSELASVDAESIELPSPTIMEHDEKEDTPEQINARHLQYTQYADMLDLEEISMPTRIHRTTNLGDMRKFVESDEMLPMNNRKSLEFEAQELQTQRSRICAQDGDGDCVMLLVENAFVMTFFGGNDTTRFWDDVDVCAVLKGEMEDYASELLQV